VGTEMCTTFCFFIHNLGSRYAKKPFKCSKDADFGLVSKNNLNQNMAQWIGAQAWVKVTK